MKQRAQAIGKSMTISPKDAIEVSNFIRGRSVSNATTILNDVIEMKIPIPYKRFTNGVGHRRGELRSGRYPILAVKAILKVVKSAEANAQVKGMNVDQLVIKEIIPNRGSRSMHYGRKRGIQTKSTNLTVTLEEGIPLKKEKRATKKETKTEKKETKNQEVKKETSKEEKKTEVEKQKEEPSKTETKEKEVKETKKTENKEETEPKKETKMETTTKTQDTKGAAQ